MSVRGKTMGVASGGDHGAMTHSNINVPRDGHLNFQGNVVVGEMMAARVAIKREPFGPVGCVEFDRTLDKSVGN